MLPARHRYAVTPQHNQLWLFNSQIFDMKYLYIVKRWFRGSSWLRKQDLNLKGGEREN